MYTKLCLFAALVSASPLSAQSDDVLRPFFEGKTVVVKIDMPATQRGVNVHPAAATPIDFSDVADNIKESGVGLHQGEPVMVTKVHVKGDHIEFQLGGGGFGTFGDLSSLPSSSVASYEGKSEREKDVEHALKYTWDRWRRDELQDELDELRRRRYRGNAWASSVNEDARQDAREEERRRRAQSGSRFNIRYENGFPAGALTPEGIMSSLSDYVEFDSGSQTEDRDATPSAPMAGAVTSLSKGMTVAQVERVLGPAAAVTSDSQGSLELVAREYSSEGEHVSASFVSGVLVDYSVTPEEK